MARAPGGDRPIVKVEKMTSGKIIPFVLAGLALAAMPARAQSGPDNRGEAGPPGAHLAAPDAQIRIGGGVIDVSFVDRAPGLNRDLVLDWIRTSARAVTTYFGRFPVPEVRLMVNARDGEGIGGTTFGFDGSLIRLQRGPRRRCGRFQARLGSGA